MTEDQPIPVAQVLETNLPAPLAEESALPAINTVDDWYDVYGKPLHEYIFKKDLVKYPCTPQRRGELDLIPGWDDIYLRELFKHMDAGKSYESFGKKFFISPARKKLWESSVQEWNFIKTIGETAWLEHWEELGLELIKGKHRYAQASIYNKFMAAIDDRFKEQPKVSKNLHLHKHENGEDGRELPAAGDIKIEVHRIGKILENDEDPDEQP